MFSNIFDIITGSAKLEKDEKLNRMGLKWNRDSLKSIKLPPWLKGLK